VILVKKRVGIALLLLGFGSVGFAQPGAGRLEGRVVKEGQGVGAVTVLVNELKKAEITDENGAFVFDPIPAGSYTLIFTLGDNTVVRQVIVLAGKPTKIEQAVDWNLGVREKVTVTAAAARAAKIVDAPAAITSVPEEVIEREAAHGQLPKILEFTPGAEVTQSGLYDFNFNTRGFNSSLNRRVSTYIDGRNVGVVLLGAQEWSALSMPLDDLAGLEFIRGPSAALYGANASSGVINITTKAPRDSLGDMFRITGGELSTFALDFRRAAELGNGWFMKVMAGLKNTGDFTVSRNPENQQPGSRCTDALGNPLPNPEYECYCDPQLTGDRGCIPPEKTLFREQNNDIRFATVRFDKYLADDTLLTFESGYTDAEGPVLQTGIGRVQIRNTRRPFARFNYAHPRWNVLAHWTHREGDQVNLNQELRVQDELITDTDRYGVEAQGNWTFFSDRMRWVIGAAYTEEEVDSPDDQGAQTVIFEPVDAEYEALFTQFDYKINDHVKLVGAGRVDASSLHDTQFSPKLAGVFSINPKHSFRLTFNKAFQVANYSEFFLHARVGQFPLLGFANAICQGPIVQVDCGVTEDPPVLAVGNDDLRLEKTQSWELGYSGLLGNRAFITIDYYRSEHEDFITDLIHQVGTSLGNTEGCVNTDFEPETDPLECPINADYLPWVSTDEAENTVLFTNPITGETLTVATALRNAVDNSVGGNRLGLRLAQDLDGGTVIVGRTYANIGDVETQGIDLGIQYFVNEAWNLQASYSWFDFEIIDTGGDASGVPVADDLETILSPNTPEHKGSLGVSFVKNRWSASLSGRWVDDFFWGAGLFQGPVESYTTADFAGSVAFNRTVSLGFNVANLLDDKHYQAYGGDRLSRRALTNLTFHW